MTGPFLGVERSVTGRRWRSRTVGDDRLAMQLSQHLGVPELIGRLLAARGVLAAEADRFLKPTLRDWLPDPSNLKDMDRAVDRLVQAIRTGETVAFFGDYDVDGAASSALLQRYLSAVGGRVRVYIPDRMVEGYGPNAPALRKLKDEGAAVVVTVDCGTTAYEALAAAREAGLDVLVIDHHAAEPELPAVFALVNPNRLDEESPHRALAAVGVAFLLVVALNRALRKAGWFAARPEPDPLAWLDLVALGTVCDVVPLVGLNRALVAQGIRVMKRRGNAGLAALADVARIASEPEAYHLGFLLGPRVNAGGRVGRADLGTRLLSSDDPLEAKGIAAELDRFNAERQAIEAMVLEQAMAQAEQQDEASPVLLVAGQGWHPGVICIVAGRLKERFHKPAAVIALEGGVGKASARSVPGFDFGAAVIAAKESGLLVAGGGHAMAAGFTVEQAQLPALLAFFTQRISEPQGLLARARKLTVDVRLGLGGANALLVQQLEKIGPFGQGNPHVRVVLEKVRNLKPDFAGEHHIKTLLVDSIGGARLSAIAFRAAGGPLGQALLETRGRLLDVAGQLRINSWNGQDSVSLLIDDICLRE